MNAKNHQWTREEIKIITKIWNTSSIDEIANELGVTKLQISYIVHEIRKAGYELTKKRRNGHLQSLIREALNIRR